ncbi:hypothetical protein [Streptosporangium carneum]|uniref:DUF2567 domain-containing protein n=1 Tax=Streptosporangium carneum TaxID=47481 RepID=A0A9W6I466_9ACTN|nr:hypothetical protein [Streptosporangium carneum]GLK10868.1 hypothetical protein GCM10017600_42740 [Streptosporangium carneum]
MRHARDFAVTVLVLGLLGVVAGVLWSLLAPRPPYAMTGQGPFLADPSTQALIAADGWFAAVTGAVGLACGAVGYSLSRSGRPLAVVLGLAGGGLLGSYLALLVGRVVNLGPANVTASGKTMSLFPGPLDLTAHGVMYAWPTLAVGLFFALEGIAGYRDSPLRRPFGGQDPYGPLSSYDISDR